LKKAIDFGKSATGRLMHIWLLIVVLLMVVIGVVRRPTLQISDPALLTFDLERQRHRGAHGIW
jgi:hypothetical protein